MGDYNWVVDSILKQNQPYESRSQLKIKRELEERH